MFSEKRHQLILAIIQQQQSATVQQLSQELGISESTVRRDLNYLAQQGLVNKVHGGASAVVQEFISHEPDMSTKESLFTREKESIGRYAASLIHGDDFVFIDAGSTTIQIVNAISGDALNATYVTNGLAHTRVLARKGCSVYVPAGRIKPRTEAIVGTGVVNSLRRYNFTKAFMGTNGISSDRGFTTPGIEEAELKLAVIRSAYECWFVADESKFDKVYAAGICELSRAGIITNWLPDNAYRQFTTIKETDVR